MKTVPKRITRRAWTGLVLLTLPMLMMATDMTMMFLVMPPLTADLTPSTTQTLWIMHVGEFAAACLVITMGWLTDRIGPRTLLLAAMALWIASGQAAFLPGTLLAARILIGVATAGHPGGVHDAAVVVHQRPSLQHRRRRDDGRVLRSVRRSGRRWADAAGALLVGLGLPHQRPRRRLVLLTGFWVFPVSVARKRDGST